MVWKPSSQLPVKDAGDVTTSVPHGIAWSNISVAEDRNIGPGKHAEQCVGKPSPKVTEVAFVDARPHGLVSTEGPWWVAKILKEWILCCRRAIGEALVEMG